MYIVVLLVVYRCSACDMSSDTERRPIGFRSPSDQIASAVRLDGVRSPMTFAKALHGMSMVFYVQNRACRGVCRCFQSSAIDS